MTDPSRPDTSRPDTSQPDASQPDTSQPDALQPDDVDDVRAPSGARLPSGPGGTAGLPGENSADGGGLDVDDLDDTTLAGDVAAPGPSDVR